MNRTAAALALSMAFAMSGPARADHIDEWMDFETFGDALSWQYLASDIPMSDTGPIKDAYWATAWRSGDETGVMLRYVFANPSTPQNLPPGGPLHREEVEVTYACSSRTARIHRMYLYGPQDRFIGSWFDPDRQQPMTFEAGSVVGQGYSRACR